MLCRRPKINRTKGGDLPDLLTARDDLSENKCSDCGGDIEENNDLKEAFIEADYESVCRSMHLKGEISYAYRLLKDAKAEIKKLKAERRSGSQSKKKVLEEVSQPQSNTNLRAPHSSNIRYKENGH